MERLADEERQMKAAHAAGVDIPRTSFVHGQDDLEAAAQEVGFPALFKPLRHPMPSGCRSRRPVSETA